MAASATPPPDVGPQRNLDLDLDWSSANINETNCQILSEAQFSQRVPSNSGNPGSFFPQAQISSYATGFVPC